MRLRLLFYVFFALLAEGTHATVLPVEFVWTGLGEGHGWSEGGNWEDNAAPGESAGDKDTDIAIFGQSDKTFVTLDAPRYLRGLVISDTTSGYFFDGGDLHLGADGILHDPVWWTQSIIASDVHLEASQTWDVQDGLLDIWGEIFSDASVTLTKTGSGSITFYGDSDDWEGNLTINEGEVIIGPAFEGHSSYLGNGEGTLTFGPPSLEAVPTLVADAFGYEGEDDDDLQASVNNPIVVNGLLSTESRIALFLNGDLTLNDDTTVNNHDSVLFLTGSILESTPGLKLTINGSGLVVIAGENFGIDADAYSGGTHVAEGALIFLNQNSIPGTGLLSVDSAGYLGLGDAAGLGISTAGFLSKFDQPATAGTIGFDTHPDILDDEGPNEFGDVDLTGFNSNVRLGSLTYAVIAGDITPASADYRFGSGGGTLEVASALTGERNVVIDSPENAPLTLRLTHSDNAIDEVKAVNSAVVFAEDALPETTTFDLDANSYAGLEVASVPNPSDAPGIAAQQDQVDAFLEHFGNDTPGVIGFDAEPGEAPTFVRANIDLSDFENGVYLGTATKNDDGPGAVFAGEITPTPDGILRLAAYKGASLSIIGQIGDGDDEVAVHIGNPNALSTFGDPVEEEYSSVALVNGDNDYSGGTTLYTGTLLIDGASDIEDETIVSGPLGTGPLYIEPHNLGFGDEPLVPQLAAIAPPGPPLSPLHLANAVVLNSSLEIGSLRSLKLSGAISGDYGLTLDNADTAQLILTGNNTFEGGIYVRGGSLIVKSNTGTGTGPLGFGIGYETTAEFQSSHPVVHGLYSYDSNPKQIVLNQEGEDPTFTIDTGYYSNSYYFNGDLHESGDPVTLHIAGNGVQILAGFNDHSGGTVVEEGATLSIHSDSQLGATPDGPDADNLVLAGGTLLTTANLALHPDRGIRLQGEGHFEAETLTTLTVAGPISGPGALYKHGIGGLTLTGENVYEGGTFIDGGVITVGDGETSGSIPGLTEAGEFDGESADPLEDVTFTGHVGFGGGLLRFNREDDVEFSGDITGPGRVHQIGSGTLILTGHNSYSGSTTIASGAIASGETNALSYNSIFLVQEGAHLFVDHSSEIKGLGAGEGTVVLGDDVTLSLDLPTFGTLRFGGSIVDAEDVQGFLEIVGNGTQVFTGNNTYTGGTRIAAGVLSLGNGGSSGWIAGDVEFTGHEGFGGGLLQFNRSDNVEFEGAIMNVSDSGAGRVSQVGGGTLTLSNSASDYTGGTTVWNGLVRVGASNVVEGGNIVSGPLGTGSATVHGNGGLIIDLGKTFLNAVTLNGGLLGGNGTLASADGLTVDSGSKLSPGEPGSPGTLHFATDLTLGERGRFLFDFLDPDGAPGTGWDLISVSAALYVSATASHPFKIQINSLSAPDTPGALAGFNPAAGDSWKIFETDGITDFEADKFLVDSSDFFDANGLSGAEGQFLISKIDDDLFLTFTPVPEPSTYALMVAGLGLIGLAAWRRRQRR